MLILVRGLPGSGKSTFAKNLCGIDAFFFHVEADMFFDDSLYGYNFDPKYLTEAHTWCRLEALRRLRQGYSVVVSNTFSQLWEMTPYLKDPFLSVAQNIEIRVARGEYENIHNVPLKTIERMRKRWEDYEGEQDITV